MYTQSCASCGLRSREHNLILQQSIKYYLKIQVQVKGGKTVTKSAQPAFISHIAVLKSVGDVMVPKLLEVDIAK